MPDRTSHTFTTLRSLRDAHGDMLADIHTRHWATHQRHARLRAAIALEVWVADDINAWHPVSTDYGTMQEALSINEQSAHPAMYRLRALK